MPTTTPRSQKSLIKLKSRADIPEFASEDEEAAFWATHELPEEVLAEMDPGGDERLPQPRTKPVSLRFDEHTLERVRALASLRHIGYQTLMKEFITERLYEEEKRQGLVGTDRSPTR